MLISPSILASDFSRLGEEAQRMEHCGADWLHIDVMDGHFVPNITLGAPIVKALRKRTNLVFDVHLMISEPHRYVEDFVKAGADIITFHTECDSDIGATLDLIHSLG
ncbi:MAG: ribulose-phosphate 3-epimerase, partial [Clostridia bacterium]|nr:ribulose-phosphate 3-epimerase [Clostridia bacterium]